MYLKKNNSYDYTKSIFTEDNINSSEYSDSAFSEVYLKKYYGGMNISSLNELKKEETRAEELANKKEEGLLLDTINNEINNIIKKQERLKSERDELENDKTKRIKKYFYELETLITSKPVDINIEELKKIKKGRCDTDIDNYEKDIKKKNEEKQELDNKIL